MQIEKTMEINDLPEEFDFADYGGGVLDGQIPFDFAKPKFSIDLSAQATLADLRMISSKMHASADELRKQLKSEGVRVFPVMKHNDTQSVETDYGAPAIGLNFVADLIDPVRSFRYDPVQVVEGQYKTHVPQAIKIGKALKKLGYKIFDRYEEQIYPSQIHFVNGGITRAFRDVVDDLVKNYVEIEEVKKNYGYNQKAVFLVPVPTYGLFLHSLKQACDAAGIEIFPVRRKDNGAVDQASLNYAIKLCGEENKRILGYYDCNPHNPTGYIREKAETEDVAGILLAENDNIIARQLDQIETIVFALKSTCKLDEIPKKWVMSLEQPQAGLVIIDDMAYEGLEHTGRKKPYSFGQVSLRVSERTAVLKGISKIGLPGARIGMMVAHAGLIEPHVNKQLMEEFSASTIGVDILAARFGEKSPHKKAFNAHSRKLSRAHNRQTGVVEAMFKGLENTNRLSEKEKQNFVKNYAAHSQIDTKRSREILSEGLAPFSLGEDVECGFFHRVNCDALAGHGIYVQFDDSLWPKPMNLRYSSHLYWVFRSFGMKVVAGSQQGLPDRSMQVRITTSLPEAEMFRFYDSMRNMRGYFFGENPQIQMDLFRTNYSQGPKYTP